VTPATFQDLVRVIKAEKLLEKKTGRPSKLTVENQVLMIDVAEERDES
jgi:hypothetical protein